MPGLLRIPRPVRAVLALVVVLVLAGTTYQGVTTALERRRYPHPGRLVDVGGHQLQIHCTGKGRPVVVLEAPAAGFSATWARVQEALTPLTRVCSYDRAGLGWSERGDQSFDAAAVPGELRALLESARERPPFVVAGAGLGAAYAHAFAARFPDITAAAVLLDEPTAEHDSRDRGNLGRVPGAAPWLARVGLLRVGALGGAQSRPAGPSARVLRAFMNRPDHLTRSAAELERWRNAVQLAGGEPDASAVSAVPVSRAELESPLTSDAGAGAAVAAITQSVRHVRR
jgi:pimeloyl-ACP methyl ester carboxylesterase